MRCDVNKGKERMLKTQWGVNSLMKALTHIYPEIQNNMVSTGRQDSLSFFYFVELNKITIKSLLAISHLKQLK